MNNESESESVPVSESAPLAQAPSSDVATPVAPPPVTLTNEQLIASTSISAWMEDSPANEFRLGGYAGTGKTTLIKELIRVLRERYSVVVCSFTGKAVDVLQRKGITAQTMHSLMYNVIPVGKGRVIFEKRHKLMDDPDVVIVDEASMVSTELYNDLCSFGTKRLFVGDPGQLEPVGDNPNLMAKPDLILQHIHRQAAQSPIINLATLIRRGGFPQPTVSDQLVVCGKQGFNLAEVNQIICARNKTRIALNDKARRLLDWTSTPMHKGEKIIVLRNNRDFGVFNGMILFVDEIVSENFGEDYWVLNCHDEINRKFDNLLVWRKPYLEPAVTTKKGDLVIPKVRDPIDDLNDKLLPLVYSTYAYAITCHKAQGSEWEHVLLLDEWMPPTVWDMKRWRYTGITRAAKKLTYFV